MGQVGEVGATETSADGYLRALADCVDEGVAICHNGLICWASSRMAELTGRAEARELLGVSMDSLLEDDGAGLPDPTGGGAADCRVRGLGRRRVWVTHAPSAAGDFESRQEIWVIADRTRQQHIEQEILELSRNLQTANRELAELRAKLREEASEHEELLSVVSHELRTPVTVISGYNRLLLSNRVGSLSDEQRRFLDESTKSCQRLNHFIENMLAASGGARDDEYLELKSASLGLAIEGVVSFLRPLIEEHDVRVELALDPEALWARFDPLRIEQVLANLLGNAIKYAKAEGEIRIETRRIEAAGHRFIEVGVADNGPGIAFEDRDRIFEPYVRATGESRVGGLGLGLAICKRIVEAHGGTITVMDRPGGGSCFAFTLPAADLGPVEAS
jgi:signal transduction histidine kinase